MRSIIAFLFMLTGWCLTEISAQEIISMQSKTKGVSAGIGFGMMTFSDEIAHPTGAELGFGFGGRLQYGFTHKFAAAFGIQNYFVRAESLNKADPTYNYLEADLMAVFIFGSTNSQLRPMLAAGGTFTKVSESYYNFNFGTIQDEVYSGVGFVGGAGLSYFIKPELSADLTLQIHSGPFSKTLIDRIQVNYQHDFYTINGLLSITYHF